MKGSGFKLIRSFSAFGFFFLSQSYGQYMDGLKVKDIVQ